MQNYADFIYKAPKAIGYTLAIIIAGYIAVSLIKHFSKLIIRKFDDENNETQSYKEVRVKTLSTVITNAARVIIWGSAIIATLSFWGVNVAPIIAGAGILGLAISFGSQSLVKDLVNGFFIIFEDQFNVGDKIEIDGKKGIVKEVNIRTVILKDEEGNKYIIPNSRINSVTRFSK